MSNELERHRFSFEGATGQLARHLVKDHGVPASTVSRWDSGLDQGSWIALDDLHQEAHMGNELHGAAQRVLGFARAHQLLAGAEVVARIEFRIERDEPTVFTLLATDLEELAIQATRCSGRVADVTGVTKSRTCGLTLSADGTCPRPQGEHV